jgi:site-specific DNA-adenine methylase
MLFSIRERRTYQGQVRFNNSKEFSVLDDQAKEKQEMVTLKSLSDLTGFPVKMIKEELFSESDLQSESISLEQLRTAMMSYLDETMLDGELD